MNEERDERLKPGTRCLFEAIKSFLQHTNMIREARINVPRRLFHIDLFSKMTIEECILDIKLVKRPVVGHIKRKDNTNSGALMTGLKVSV